MEEKTKEKLARTFAWICTGIVIAAIVSELISLVWIMGGLLYTGMILFGILKMIGLVVCQNLLIFTIIAIIKRYKRRR